jgi:AraC-like DNA-binding protein
MSVLEILIRGLAAGILLATSVGILRTERPAPAHWAGTLFALSAAAFAVHSGGAETQALGPLLAPVWFLSAGGIGYFWLFGTTLFNDKRFTWTSFAPIVVLTVVAAVGSSLPLESARGVWIVHNLLEIAVVAHLLYSVWQSWRGDLVEARRALRGPFIVGIGIYCIVLSGVEVGEYLGFEPSWLGLAQALTLAVMGLAGIAVFLRADPTLFEARRRAPAAAAPEPIEPKDRPLLAKLQTLMQAGEVWRREGLTIGQLAGELGAQEHRLRRLINDGLGHRNFADFLNARRIEAAKAALADATKADQSISTIAFELGYASLGPFNRAFKDLTGTTPTAFRAAALSPNPKTPP